MHDALITYISNYSSSLTDNDIELIKRAFTPKRIRKRQYFLQEGEVCKYSAFIIKGAMRQYSVDDKGAEHIVHLSIENWWTVDRESYVNLTPSIYYIDAWEDTDVLLITKADFIKYVNGIPAIAEMTRMLDEKHSIAVQKRLNASISLSAEKRYVNFANSYPELLQRFPQHIIASYLGITKETLSRVRRQMIKG
ncbi:MAG: cyclic nucleotide-binding protein [Sediminibacterium sp.]|nr:cyclic nucleotide-binding protein [Sediminibacterium sp.]